MSCASGSTRRILVIAADDNFSGTIGRILCRCGYETERVSSGEAAMEALERAPYDLVLSEVALPGVCGLTVLCRARQHGRKIPFVLIGAPETERRRWRIQPASRTRGQGSASVRAAAREPSSGPQVSADSEA